MTNETTVATVAIAAAVFAARCDPRTPLMPETALEAARRRHQTACDELAEASTGFSYCPVLWKVCTRAYAALQELLGDEDEEEGRL